MWKECLENEDDKIKCLVFNGWLCENYEDANTAVLGSILGEIILHWYSGNLKTLK